MPFQKLHPPTRSTLTFSSLAASFSVSSEKTGRPCEELLPLLDRAISLAPARAGYWEKRAGYREGLGDLAGALLDIDRAISLADRPYLRYSRAILLCKSGRCVEALSDLDAAIASQPDNLQFYRVRAIARASARKAALALEDGELLVVRAPQSGESYYARGVALAAFGRTRSAVDDFSSVLRMRPDLVYPLAARADGYEKLGELELAAADRSETWRRSVGHGGGRAAGGGAEARGSAPFAGSAGRRGLPAPLGRRGVHSAFCGSSFPCALSPLCLPDPIGGWHRTWAVKASHDTCST